MDPRIDEGDSNKGMDSFVYNTEPSVFAGCSKIYQSSHFGVVMGRRSAAVVLGPFALRVTVLTF